MKHTHVITLPGITSPNCRKCTYEASRSVGKQIAADLTPEQRDAIARTVLTIAVLDHLANRHPFENFRTAHGFGVHEVCTSCLKAAGLDLYSLIRILS